MKILTITTACALLAACGGGSEGSLPSANTPATNVQPPGAANANAPLPPYTPAPTTPPAAQNAIAPTPVPVPAPAPAPQANPSPRPASSGSSGSPQTTGSSPPVAPLASAPPSCPSGEWYPRFKTASGFAADHNCQPQTKTGCMATLDGNGNRIAPPDEDCGCFDGVTEPTYQICGS